MKFDPKKIDEIFKDNKQYILEDGGKIIGPGPCQLSISDWMNFLTNLWVRYDDAVSKAYNWRFTMLFLNLAVGTFIFTVFANIFSNEEITYTIIIAIIIYGFVSIGAFSTINFYSKIMKNQSECREGIYRIISSIIHGTLRDSDIIREVYLLTSKSLHIKADKLIKDLKIKKYTEND